MLIAQPRTFYVAYALICAVFFLNAGGNAIWTTHEAYYAEAVRVMIESGSWMEFYFNGEPRFQKPPMTYWLMASSASLFGLSEFTLRLPIIICSLFIVLLVYLIGKTLYDHLSGMVSMMVFSASLQFAWLKHFATPEVPLTLFFVLAVYWLIYAHVRQKPYFRILSFFAIGVAALTKGFPFILLFFLIVVILSRWPKPILKISNWSICSGLLISLLTGLSWPLYMSLRHGKSYAEILWFETIGRSSGLAGGSLIESLYFYPVSLAWGLLPFTLVFAIGIFKAVRDGVFREEVFLPLTWLTVFLVAFSLSVFKLPVYLLPAYPAIALISGRLIVSTLAPATRFTGIALAQVIPASGMILGYFVVVHTLELSQWLYLPLMVAIAVTLWWRRTGGNSSILIANWSIAIAFVVLINLGLMPWVEQFRPYREMASLISNAKVEADVPLLIENRLLDNMPYYAKRKVINVSSEKIGEAEGEQLLLISGDQSWPGAETLWQGAIHAKGAEDHYFKFFRDCYLYAQGDLSRFTTYRLVHIKPQAQ